MAFLKMRLLVLEMFKLMKPWSIDDDSIDETRIEPT